MVNKPWDTARRAEGSQGPNEVRMRSAKQNQDFRRKDCISRSDMAQALGYGSIERKIICINYS